MGFDFLLVQPQAFIEKKKPRLRRKDWTRVYLKTPNAPGQRAFLRCAASFFLEIRQYSCEKMSCATQKSLAAGHIMSFQTHPSLAMRGLGRSEPHVVHQQKCRTTKWKVGHQHAENAKFHPKRDLKRESKAAAASCSRRSNVENIPEKAVDFSGLSRSAGRVDLYCKNTFEAGRRETHFFQRKFGQTRKTACGTCTAGIRCQLFSSESSSSEDIFKIPASSQPDIVSRSASFRL